MGKQYIGTFTKIGFILLLFFMILWSFFHPDYGNTGFIALLCVILALQLIVDQFT